MFNIKNRTQSGFPVAIGTGLALETLHEPVIAVYDPSRTVPPRININVDEIVSSSFNAISISYSNNINITANKLIIGPAANIYLDSNCSGPVNITYNELIYNSPGKILYLQGSGDVVINGNIYQTQNYDNISLVEINKTFGNVVINGNVSTGDCFNSFAIFVSSGSSLMINGTATSSNHLSKTAYAIMEGAKDGH